nr:hypothetical protein [Lupinus angustifolius]
MPKTGCLAFAQARGCSPKRQNGPHLMPLPRPGEAASPGEVV